MPGKDTQTEEYRAQNPIGAVPRLVEEDGFVLNESHAIMCYLGDKFKWKLYPEDAKVRARIHQYMNWHHSNTRRITIALFAPVMRPDMPLPKEMCDAYRKEITGSRGILSTIERFLSSSTWLCGERPTIAVLLLRDRPVPGQIHRSLRHPRDRPVGISEASAVAGRVRETRRVREKPRFAHKDGAWDQKQSIQARRQALSARSKPGQANVASVR
eukprot:CAMPEP_0177307326 /NCGR_PEP_ID=MMETSP0368-20130122/8188_1 /TAXON_ID=447022 ORGANISM="Scrippsiella hangoei-like, Strain SHHI-4" /NCGR_SAMPLE_ID=MMETSP0368 /ASSEMBLY_ACC=CAM_ASM_000363 /LENGTH=213 /DNA_ID=CAMNT_0018766095 /DNA_START=57 /DNA_END=694 /DNA_ORIENTATION=-